MTHKIFGYKGFVVRVIPHKVISQRYASRFYIRYTASVIIVHFMGAARRKYETRGYPSGICATPERALELGAEYATQVIDDNLAGGMTLEAAAY